MSEFEWFDLYPFLCAGAFGLMLVWLWGRAAVAAWRAGLPRRVIVGCGIGVAAGLCGVALAAPSTWDHWQPLVLAASGLVLGSTLGPALVLWGLAVAWRELEASAGEINNQHPEARR